MYLMSKTKWSNYPNDKLELVSHLNIDNSEIFHTQFIEIKA